MGDLGSIPGLGRSPGEEKGYPLQYSGLENLPWTIQSRGSKESDMTSLSLEDSEGQGNLACYSPWGYKELDMT